MYMHVHMFTCVHTSVHTWRSEEYLRELVPSFYHVGSGTKVQPSGLVDRGVFVGVGSFFLPCGFRG